MSPFLAEIIGTMILILLGNGVVANALLHKSKGKNAGWVTITLAWGFAVYTAVLIAGPYSGAHLNPAVTFGLAIAGKFPWSDMGIYLLGQGIGAAIGQTLVVFAYWDHYHATEEKDLKLATFCTIPAIRNMPSNLMTEAIGTFVLVFAVLYIAGPSIEGQHIGEVKMGLGSLGALPVALIVVVIGMSLGGPTGYAINPARDLIPRIMHTILPIGKKGDSDWNYAFIPIVGPLIGAAIAGSLYLVLL